MNKTHEAISAIALQRRQSLTAIVVKELERMILSGELKAGERLNELSLATRLGVSRGPIREARRALERAGLVISIANRGVFIRRFDSNEVAELYDMRALITGFACGILAKTATKDQMAALRNLVKKMDAAIGRGDTTVYYQTNLKFHDLLMAFSGHGRAAQIYEALVKEMHLIRQLVLSPKRSNVGHGNIIKAIASGDVERARHVGEGHVLEGKSRWQQKNR